MIATWPRYRGPIRIGLSVLGVAVLVVVYGVGRAGFDFYAYWAVDPADPYRIVDAFGAFHYAPPLAYLAGPLKALPFDVAYVAWTLLNVAVLVWLTRTWAVAWCAFPPVASELFHGNVHLLLAAAVVLAWQHGAAWTFHLLSKVTTGVGLIWAVVRRDRSTVVAAVATTGAVVFGSVLLQGADVWFRWVEHLASRAGQPEDGGALLDISILVRLPVAVALGVWGAWTGRRWTVPLAATVALPLLWFHSLAMLTAIPASMHTRMGSGPTPRPDGRT